MASTSIVLGLSESVDELAAILCAGETSQFATFPFVALTTRGDGPWRGVRRAMDDVETIRFTLKGMRKAVFQRWLNSGRYLSEPVLGQRGWTNRELYEVQYIDSQIFAGKNDVLWRAWRRDR